MELLKITHSLLFSILLLLCINLAIMDLSAAKVQFIELVKQVNSGVVCDFLTWIQESDQFKCKQNEDIILDNIVEDIRNLIPFEGTFPSENISIPSVGKNSDCEKEVLLHVDSFLFSDDYIDDLVDDGNFSRNYCNACGSKDTKPLTFISHSASIASLHFIFKQALPDMAGRTLVDIGSRLGPVLYGAYLFTSCERIIGIEVNSDLCDLQNNIVNKYKMNDRITIVHDDVMKCQNILQSGDVIMMNNVFEFFADEVHLQLLWSFVISSLKGSNKILVTVPSLEESLAPIGLLSLLDNFMEEVTLDFDNSEDVDDIHMYKILPKA